jgi:uncharacterized protein YukE
VYDNLACGGNGHALFSRRAFAASPQRRSSPRGRGRLKRPATLHQAGFQFSFSIAQANIIGCTEIFPMAKANVDPAELRRFAQDLARFNNDLQGLVASLHSKMQGLEANWRDQEQRKFSEAFSQTTKALGTFLEASQQHVSFLGKKAMLIEDYLKQR